MAPLRINATESAGMSAGAAARASAPSRQPLESNRTEAKRSADSAMPSRRQARPSANDVAAESTRLGNSARVRMDETGRRPIIQILDENKEVVRQYPPEELLKISSKFLRLQGLLFDERG